MHRFFSMGPILSFRPQRSHSFRNASWFKHLKKWEVTDSGIIELYIDKTRNTIKNFNRIAYINISDLQLVRNANTNRPHGLDEDLLPNKIPNLVRITPHGHSGLYIVHTEKGVQVATIEKGSPTAEWKLCYYHRDGCQKSPCRFETDDSVFAWDKDAVTLLDPHEDQNSGLLSMKPAGSRSRCLMLIDSKLCDYGVTGMYMFYDKSKKDLCFKEANQLKVDRDTRFQFDVFAKAKLLNICDLY